MMDQKAATIAKIFVEELCCRYGTPKKILTDQGKNFMSVLLKEITDYLSIKKLRTSPYHPQTDGQTERYNRTLIEMLSCYVNKHQTDWDEYIKYCLFAYRMGVHEATQQTPFKMMYGRECNLPIDLEFQPTTTRYMDEPDYHDQMKERFHEIWKLAGLHVKFNQESFKELYDRKAKGHTFTVGQKILIHTPTIMPGTVDKLKRPWKGPYEIITVYDTNVKARLCSNPMKKPTIVHVNRCRSAQENADEKPIEKPIEKEKEREKEIIVVEKIKRPRKRREIALLLTALTRPRAWWLRSMRWLRAKASAPSYSSPWSTMRFAVW